MPNRKALLHALILGLSMVATASLLLAQEAGPTVIKEGVTDDDLYLAGETVEVLAEVNGDVVAAGRRVSVDGAIAQDALLAGAEIDIRGRVEDDLRAAGGELTITGQVGGDAILAGGRIELTANSTVGGRAWLAGGAIELGGRVGRELRAAGGTITIAGQIRGDANLAGETIRILPGAVIAGDLIYRSSREAEIYDGAQIGGEIRYLAVTEDEAGPLESFLGGLLFSAALAVVGVVLVLLFPRFLVTAARGIGDAPLKCLGLGLAVLVATPVAVALLLITVIGIPLALMVLTLYFVMLLAGYLTGVLFLGDAGLRLLGRGERPGRGAQLLALVAALVALALLWPIPFVGGLCVLLVLLFGAGALKLGAYRAWSVSRP